LKESRLIHIEELTRWAQKDDKGNKKTLYLKQIIGRNDVIMRVDEQSRLEILRNYEDRWPLLSLRKSLWKVQIYINLFCLTIISHKLFETICITVILLNSFTLALEDPLAVGTTQTDEVIENLYNGAYTIEMVLKIVGLGFIFNKGAYLRDPWNMLDFFIVMSSYVTIAQDVIAIQQNGGTKPI
jgi:hypothetical protein